MQVHMGNFGPVARDEIQATQPKMVNHKLTSFAAVVALWILVTLAIKLIHILLMWNYVQGKDYAILAAMLLERSYFV